MRWVEVLELTSEVLPRRWVRKAGVIVVLALLVSGTFNDAASWYVREKAAALQESLVEPILERFIEQLATPSQTSSSSALSSCGSAADVAGALFLRVDAWCQRTPAHYSC